VSVPHVHAARRESRFLTGLCPRFGMTSLTFPFRFLLAAGQAAGGFAAVDGVDMTGGVGGVVGG